MFLCGYVILSLCERTVSSLLWPYDLPSICVVLCADHGVQIPALRSSLVLVQSRGSDIHAPHICLLGWSRCASVVLSALRLSLLCPRVLCYV